MAFGSAVSSQAKYKIKDNLAAIPQEVIVKHADSLFYFQGNVSYNISLDHIKPYKDITVDKSLQAGYLEKQMALLAKDPSNYILYGNIALYHQNKGDADKAAEYYTQALNKIKLLPKAKDSASYYSNRGIYKFNLGQEGTADIEKALSINKADSVAVMFYPMFLIQNQRFAEARKVLVNVISNPYYMKYSYLCIFMADFFEACTKLPVEGDALTAALKKTDMNTFINMDPYDKYINKSDPDYYKIKQMTEVFYGLMKFGPGLQDVNYKPDAKDIAFMEAKEAYFKTVLNDKNSNTYGAYLVLGTLNFLQKKYQTAIVYYDKALQAFPKEKEGFKFNTVDVYNNMATIYHQGKKYNEAIEVLTTKLLIKSLSAEERSATFLNLARLNFEMENFDKANDYALEAAAINQSFDANFLLSHINLRQGSNVLADLYREKANTRLTNADICTFMEYMTAVFIAGGQADIAWDFYEGNKKNFNVECEECQKLLDHYLVLNK